MIISKYSEVCIILAAFSLWFTMPNLNKPLASPKAFKGLVPDRYLIFYALVGT